MRRWIIIGAVVVVIVVVAAVGAFALLNGGDDSDSQAATSELPPISSISSVVADAVVLPKQSAELSMPTSGIVDELLVEEGEVITMGRGLVRLVNDDETEVVARAQADIAKAEARLAKLRAQHAKTQEDEDEARPVDIANARLAIRDIVEELAHVSGANQGPGAVLTPEGAAKEAARQMEIAEARDTLREAQDTFLKAMGVEATQEITSTPKSITNVALREMAIADTRLSVLDAEEELEDADDLQDLLVDAQDEVRKGNNDLDNAQRDLEVARLAEVEDIRKAEDVLDEAKDDLIELFDRFLGITPTDDELLQDPDTLFEAWGVDLEQLFDRKNPIFPDGVLKDDPSTKWNELRIFAWTRLHPQNQAVDVACEERVNEKLRRCLQQDFEDSWEAFDNTRIDFDTIVNDIATAIADAENRITTAEQALEDAQEELDDLSTDRPDLDVAVAEAILGDTLAALNDLVDFPDPVEVETARADMAAVQAALNDLLDWPDPLKAALAREELAKAEMDLTKLMRGRDPLDIAREQAELAEAEADIESLRAALALAQISLDDMELKAPFGGTVVSVEVDLGEEVDTDTVVVRIADVSEWLIETDDLDELSVVNLAEGDKVTVTFDALPDLEVIGSVININEFGEKKQGAITYTAEIRLDRQDERLRWNMTAAIKKDADNSTASLNANR